MDSKLKFLDDDERVMKLWTPFQVRVGPDFEFVKKNVLFRGASWLIRHVAAAILFPALRFLFGVQVRGREQLREIQGRGYISVCNHVHPLDCVMVALALGNCGLYYPTLTENLEVPLVRWLVRILGGVPIPKSAHAYPAFSQAMADVLARGSCIHFFSEGVLLPYSDGVRPLRRGAFQLACWTKTPVVPLVISYRPLQGFRRLIRRKPLIDVTILPPLMPDCRAHIHADSVRLCRECGESMREAYAQARSHYENTL